MSETSDPKLMNGKRRESSSKKPIVTPEGAQTRSRQYQENETADSFVKLRLSVKRKPVLSESRGSTSNSNSKAPESNEAASKSLPSSTEENSEHLMMAEEDSHGDTREETVYENAEEDYDDENGSETEEEIELIDLLRQKAGKAGKELNYNIEERYLTKFRYRLSKLQTRKPRYLPSEKFELSLVALLRCQVMQMKWQEAKDNFANISRPDVKHDEDPESLLGFYDFFIILARIELGELDSAMVLCVETLRARRKLFGKKDVRYFEILALKVRILSLQGDLEEAEAYREMLPEANDFELVIKGDIESQTPKLTTNDVAEIVEQLSTGWTIIAINDASLSVRDPEGFTPFLRACYDGNEIVARNLLSRRATRKALLHERTTNSAHTFPGMILAVWQKHEKVIRLLLEFSDSAITLTDPVMQYTALHYAVFNIPLDNNTTIIKLLLEFGKAEGISAVMESAKIHGPSVYAHLTPRSLLDRLKPGVAWPTY